MLNTDSNRLLAKQMIFLISAHTALLILCSFAHEKIDSLYSLSFYLPIILLFCLAPLVSVFLLLTQLVRQGVVLLLGILPAILIYNITSRFSAYPAVAPQGALFIWKIIYEGSFGLILILEIISIWIAVKLLRKIHKQIDTQTTNTQKQ